MLSRRFALLAAILLGVVGTPYLLPAQPDSKSPAAPGRQGPLPNYFGKLVTSPQQREKLYGVQREYDQKIEDLLAKIRMLEQERDEKMETLLTAGQKLRLKELREEANRTRDDKPKAPAPLKPTPFAPDPATP